MKDKISQKSLQRFCSYKPPVPITPVKKPYIRRPRRTPRLPDHRLPRVHADMTAGPLLRKRPPDPVSALALFPVLFFAFGQDEIPGARGPGHRPANGFLYVINRPGAIKPALVKRLAAPHIRHALHAFPHGHDCRASNLFPGIRNMAVSLRPG